MQSVKQEVRDLERVRYVTENYADLQGLTRVQVGLMILVVYLLVVFTNFEITTQLVADIVVTLVVLVGTVLVVGFFKTRRYYENRYGRVRVVPRVFKRRRVYGGVLVFVAMIVVFYLALWVYEYQNLEPYPFLLILLGTMEVFDRWPELRFRPHHFLLGVVMMISGLVFFILTLQGSQNLETLFLHLLVTLFVLQLVVGGILDHLLLVRTMKTLPEENDG